MFCCRRLRNRTIILNDSTVCMVINYQSHKVINLFTVIYFQIFWTWFYITIINSFNSKGVMKALNISLCICSSIDITLLNKIKESPRLFQAKNPQFHYLLNWRFTDPIYNLFFSILLKHWKIAVENQKRMQIVHKWGKN